MLYRPLLVLPLGRPKTGARSLCMTTHTGLWTHKTHTTSPRNRWLLTQQGSVLWGGSFLVTKSQDCLLNLCWHACKQWCDIIIEFVHSWLATTTQHMMCFINFDVSWSTLCKTYHCNLRLWDVGSDQFCGSVVELLRLSYAPLARW